MSGPRTPAPAMGRSADRLRYGEPRCGHSLGRPGQNQKGWITLGSRDSGTHAGCRMPRWALVKKTESSELASIIQDMVLYGGCLDRYSGGNVTSAPVFSDPFQTPSEPLRQIRTQSSDPINQSGCRSVTSLTLNDTAPESDLSIILNLTLAVASKYDCLFCDSGVVAGPGGGQSH